MDRKAPCPFCGADDDFLSIGMRPTLRYNVLCTWIECMNCGAQGPVNYADPENSENCAEFTWNERVEVSDDKTIRNNIEDTY